MRSTISNRPPTMAPGCNPETSGAVDAIPSGIYASNIDDWMAQIQLRRASARSMASGLSWRTAPSMESMMS